jgi:hypothetical protein
LKFQQEQKLDNYDESIKLMLPTDGFISLRGLLLSGISFCETVCGRVHAEDADIEINSDSQTHL